MAPEIIDVDAFDEPDVQITGQYRRKRFTLREPVSKRAKKPVVFDLTLLDDDDVKPQPSPGPSRVSPPPSSAEPDKTIENLEAVLLCAHSLALEREGKPSGVPSATVREHAGQLDGSHSDSESDVLGDVLDIYDHTNWSYTPAEKESAVVDDVSSITDKLKICSIEPRVDPACQAARPYKDEPQFISDWLHREDNRGCMPILADLVSASSHRRHAYRSVHPVFLPTKQAEFPHCTSGAVNVISQSNGIMALASCADGGNFDIDPQNQPYNKEGSLKILCGDTNISLNGHKATPVEGIEKYFTVNDVQFDPTLSTQMVSCGHDGKLMVWDCTSTLANGAQPILKDAVFYGKEAIPSGILFRPENSQFAVWTFDGSMYLHDTALALSLDETFPPPSSKSKQLAQSVSWGHGPTSHLLFATYAPTDDKPKGYHWVYNAELMKVSHKYKEVRPGECLDVDPKGKQLALVTRKGGMFRLSIYDALRDSEPASIELPIQSTHHGFCIQQVLFSPDSTLLAVATSDNVTYVYDSRFLRYGALYEFPHVHGTEGSAEDTTYGIPKVEWYEDPVYGLSLISGGADGVVRLWDIKHGQDMYADTTLATLPSYIGWFSLGDTFKGEKALVVGDGSGNVIIQN